MRPAPCPRWPPPCDGTFETRRPPTAERFWSSPTATDASWTSTSVDPRPMSAGGPNGELRLWGLPWARERRTGHRTEAGPSSEAPGARVSASLGRKSRFFLDIGLGSTRRREVHRPPCGGLWTPLAGTPRGAIGFGLLVTRPIDSWPRWRVICRGTRNPSELSSVATGVGSMTRSTIGPLTSARTARASRPMR